MPAPVFLRQVLRCLPGLYAQWVLLLLAALLRRGRKRRARRGSEEGEISNQLEQAQAFQQVQAVVLGHFTGCEEPETGQKRIGPVPNAKEVLTSHFERLQIPVFDGLPCGHESPNHIFPVGAHASIQATADQATLYMTLQSEAE